MNYKFHPLAIKELEDAIDYYSHINDALDVEFLEEFYSSIHRIQEFPNAWTKLSKESRRCILNRFPYAIIYLVKNQFIVIIAVMQLNRKPNYWENRM